MKKLAFIILISNLSFSQYDIFENDTIKKIKSVIVNKTIQTPEYKKDVEDNIIYTGKKNETIKLNAINANTTNNNAREIFSRVPGVTVWEYDGSGTQINIGFRGLNPNRSWELNTRQNGYDMSSDVFGYPEAYYNPPIEAVDKIEIIRGSASLQFGPQFGGMVNYKIKREEYKPFSFESHNTIASYGLLSSFNSIGGSVKKWQYYAFHSNKKGDGWRDNSGFISNNTHLFLGYNFNNNTKISAEYTYADYEMKQPGGLTDLQFAQNSRQSTRNRNWFNVPWNIYAINFDTKFSDNFTFNANLFGLAGKRNSVGYLGAINTVDNLGKRRVDRDFYQNIGLETRAVYSYKLRNRNQDLAFGIRAYKAHTDRKQNGTGDSGNNLSLFVENNKFATDLNLNTNNYAFFAENKFQLTDNFSVVPGIRYENIQSTIDGRLSVTNNIDVNLSENKTQRNLLLLGLGAQYDFGKTNIYGNLSQAYRPALFSDITPPATTDIIDSNLKDSNGFNFDFGYRGVLKDFLNFDINVFYLKYNDRIGLLRKYINDNPALGTYQLRTNVGNSSNQGIESFVEFDITKALSINNYGALRIFISNSFISATYDDFETNAITGAVPNIIITKTNLKDKQVEYAPKFIHQFGLSYHKKGFSTTFQGKYSDGVFTDATNTEAGTANATAGYLEAYKVYDWALEYTFHNTYLFKAGINNLFNQTYATRRAGGYPGPGIIPNEGRTFYLTLGIKL